MYIKNEAKVKFWDIDYLDTISFLNSSLYVEKVLTNVVSKREEKLL